MLYIFLFHYIDTLFMGCCCSLSPDCCGVSCLNHILLSASPPLQAGNYLLLLLAFVISYVVSTDMKLKFSFRAEKQSILPMCLFTLAKLKSHWQNKRLHILPMCLFTRKTLALSTLLLLISLLKTTESCREGQDTTNTKEASGQKVSWAKNR